MKNFCIIPAYNEESTIYEVVKRTKDAGLETLVIDDHSTDKTREIAEKAGALVITHEVNKGKGESIKTGFKFLKSNPEVKNIVLIDADLQYSPEEATKLLAPLEEGRADFVTGYREWKGIPFRHRMGNWVWRNSFNLLFGSKLKDSNCGFMAMTKSSMEKIKNIGGGYIIENELFVEAFKNGFKIEQIPVSVKYNEKSGVLRGIRVVFGVLTFIIKEGIKYRVNQWI